ncbi:hypothetical protein [Nocardia aurea]|uniref:DUF4190 domain-containing protein n=1 Tax=Nocardia aurea TaxID=2144174 RepID=A0ABV3FTN1_9NOCA
MPDRPSRPEPRNGVGVIALAAGIVALVFAFVPAVGDLVAVPAAVIAVVCGWVGFARWDRGQATNPRDAVVGGTLGTVALFVWFLVFAATNGTAA